jgi:uncharacterized membrane protein
MSSYRLALLLHLIGAIGFFSGLAVAAAAQAGARRRERAGEIVAVLALARVGVLLVAGGLVLVVAGGLWLIEETAWSLGDGWLTASLGLLAASVVLGAVGGRKPKRARLLAERQPPAARPDAEIGRLLRDRASWVANAAASAAAFAVLVLMIWRPS